MKAGKILKITLVSLLFLGVVMYVAYAMLFLSGPDEDEKCTTVELLVKQNDSSKFVDEKEVEDMLKRSFAEFHAQKKLPEQQQLLMRKLSQPTKTIEYVSRILVINGHILFTINILYFRLQCMLVLQMFCLV